MIDKWDIALFKRFLKLAESKGTDTIKVISGDKPNTWIVTIVNGGNKIVEQTKREPIKCPMCLEATMEDKSIGDVYKATGTEIYICPVCPCVVFEYHNQQNWMDVGCALGLEQVE